MSNEHGAEFNMVKLIWRTFWILLVVTTIEIAAAIFLTDFFTMHGMKLVLNIFYILMSLTKAFYIVAVFMHLRFEMKYLVITILIPSTFLLFAVISLLAEGNSWLHMRTH